MKIVIALIILIPALIAALLLFIAWAIVRNPGILMGEMQGLIVGASIVAGIILLLPLLIGGTALLLQNREKKARGAMDEATEKHCA